MAVGDVSLLKRDEYLPRMKSRIDVCLYACDTDKVNDWEISFLENLQEIIKKGVKLSERQERKLTEIEEKLYGEVEHNFD